MTAAFVVISAALALAPLPPRGFALETKPRVQLQNPAGRPVALLGGMDLAAGASSSSAETACARAPSGGATQLRR
jgi:hypothetical protein